MPVARTFDLIHVDPAAFATALGNDPVRIFHFVRDQIAFEPYVGALRGPRGTLMAMAGNSVDRAALLASLLVSADQQVRFVRSQLPDTTARELVSSIWAGRALASAANSDLPPAAEKAEGDKWLAAVQRDATLLRGMLKKSGHPVAAGPGLTLDSLVGEARDHYWIQWLKAGDWIDLDPSFANAEPGKAAVTPEETFDALPDTLFHRVEIRVRIEEYSGGTPSNRDVLEYTANAADLSGVDLLLAHELEGSGQQSRSVVPVMLVRQERVVGSPFSVKPGRPAAATAVADALGGGEDDPSTVATAETVELDFVAPDGSRETVVREIFDRAGPKRRLSGEMLPAAQLASTGVNPDELTGGIYDFLLTTGAIHASHLDDLQNLPTPAGDDSLDIRAALRRISITFSAASDGLLARVTTPTGDVIGRTYLDTPRVQVAELSIRAGAARISLDLRRDQARTVVKGFKPEQLFFAGVVRGVINGTLERSVIEYFVASGQERAPATTPMSTSRVFDLAQASKVSAVLYKQGGPALPADLPADARARIQQSLTAGLLAAAPTRPVVVDGVPRYAWWQIDPRSGATIAVTDEGLHQATGDYVVTKDGSYIIRVGVNGRLKNRIHARSVEEAKSFISYLTRKYKKDGMDILWNNVIM